MKQQIWVARRSERKSRPPNQYLCKISLYKHKHAQNAFYPYLNRPWIPKPLIIIDQYVYLVYSSKYLHSSIYDKHKGYGPLKYYTWLKMKVSKKMARKVLAITISTTNIQVFRQHLLQCHHHDCTVVGFLREVSRALQRPPRKLQFCIQAKRKAAFPEALHMMRKANSILRPSTMLLQQQHRPLQYILGYTLLSMCCFHAEPSFRFLYFAQLSLSFLLFSYIRGRTLCCVCVWGESSPPTALMKAKEKGLSYCYCLFVILRKG